MVIANTSKDETERAGYDCWTSAFRKSSKNDQNTFGIFFNTFERLTTENNLSYETGPRITPRVRETEIVVH
jgi:hypothetical protein